MSVSQNIFGHGTLFNSVNVYGAHIFYDPLFTK